MNQKMIIFSIVIIMTACSSSPSVMPSPISIVTPSSTLTPEPSPTATSVPLGGGDLLVAFYAFGDCGSCLIIGNFFTGEILLEIPVNSSFKHERFPRGGQIYWSPDGKNLIYTDTNLERMNVFLVNLETKQPKKLGDFPSSGGTPAFWNYLRWVKWSYDSEYVIYDVVLENDDKLQKSYYATKDGVSNSYEGQATDWFPNNKTIFIIYGGKDSYNVETQTFVPVPTGVLSKFNAVHVLQRFIILEKEKTKVTAIPFPANWNDPAAWQYDTLNSQVVTLAELSKEIKNGEISNIFIAEQINDNQIVLVGYVQISNQLSYFLKLVNLQNLPAEINVDDMFRQQGEIPLIVSPDGNYYLKSFCTFYEACTNFDPNWENNIARGWGLQVINFDGTEQALPTDLSQFKGVTKASVNINPSGENLLNGMAFYWK